MRSVCLLACGIVVLLSYWQEAVAADAPGFEGVKEARVQPENGVPRLMVNGKPTEPLIFFPNTDIPGEASGRLNPEQVRLAAGAGVHIYSFPFQVVHANGLTQPDFAHAEKCMAMLVANDPQAMFLLRIYPGPDASWKEWASIPQDEIATFADGSKHFVSAASETFRRLFRESLVATIRYCEASPYANRILGYHPGGPEHEMFEDQYREKGPDLCEANQRGFRVWLKAKYKTEDALHAAWGNPELTFDTVRMTGPEPGRFPMHSAKAGQVERIFYRLPQERNWVDYSAYRSDNVADRIVEWAKIIKQETAGKRLAVFFCGYTFELCGSFAGHYCIDRLLACPEIDALASPYSYMDRMGGGTGGFMSLVDSITAHGKLWFNEDDTRTSELEQANMYPGVNLWQGDKAKDMAETLGVLDRNFGAVLTHRAGTWWMDLMGAGAFKSPDQWALMKARLPLYQDVYARPTPYKPDAAIIIDDRSKDTIRSDWDGNFQILVTLRNESMRAGVPIGFYTLTDFLAGAVPACKAYVMGNAFDLSDAQAVALRKRLEADTATIVWLYAPNCFGPKGFDPARAEAACGIAMGAKDGKQGSQGKGLLDTRAWGWANPITPRPIIADPAAEAIGYYADGGAISAAVKKVGKGRSIVLADMAITADVLRAIFENAGIHIWTRGREVIQTDGRTFMMHDGAAATHRVSLPEGVTAEVIQGTVQEKTPREIVLNMQTNETIWLKLAR